MTLEHFLGHYPRLCGMTGTVQAAAGELQDAYGLGVVVVPTHRPRIRRDHADVVYTHREAKEKGLVEEIRRAHATRRPVLVGTLSVSTAPGASTWPTRPPCAKGSTWSASAARIP